MAAAVAVGPVQYGGKITALRKILSEHFHRLGALSREMRFKTCASDHCIDRIVDRLSPDCVIGLEIDGATRGILEIHRLDPGHAEIGISVEDAYQGKGYGHQLFEAGLRQARDMKIETAELFFSAGNMAILRMVRSAGGRLESLGGEYLAKIDVRSHLAEG